MRETIIQLGEKGQKPEVWRVVDGIKLRAMIHD